MKKKKKYLAPFHGLLVLLVSRFVFGSAGPPDLHRWGNDNHDCHKTEGDFRFKQDAAQSHAGATSLGGYSSKVIL